MAKIPSFFASSDFKGSTVGVSVDPGTVSSLTTTGQEGRLLQEIGGKLQAESERQLKQDEVNRENSYLSSSVVDFQMSSLDEFENRKKQAGGNVDNFANDFNGWFKGQSSAILGAAPSERARIRMEGKLGGLQVRFAKQGLAHERNTRRDVRMAQIDSVSNRLINRVGQNPGEFLDAQSQIATLTSSLESEGLSSGQASKVQKNLDNKLRSAQLRGMVDSNPAGVLEALGMEEYQDIPPSQYDSLTKASSRLISQQIQKEELVGLYHSGAPLDSGNKDHRKAADFAFEEFVGEHINLETGKLNSKPAEFLGGVTAFLEHGNSLMPQRLESLISANVVNGTPKSKAMYSKLIERINTTPKLKPLLDSFDSDVLAEASIINRLTKSGTSAKNASEIARLQIREPRSDLEQRRVGEIKEGKMLTTEVVSDQLDDIFGDTTNAGLATEAYKNLFKDNFLKTGDADSSYEAADRQIKRTYSATQINGDKEIMRFSPESLYPNHINDFRNEAGKFINNFSDKKVNDEEQGFFDSVGEFFTGQRPLKLNKGGVDLPVKVVSDVLTGKGKGYAIITQVRQADGTLTNMPLLDPNTGLPVRFSYSPGDTASTLPQHQDAIKRAEEIQRLAQERREEHAQALDTVFSGKRGDQIDKQGIVAGVIEK